MPSRRVKWGLFLSAIFLTGVLGCVPDVEPGSSLPSCAELPLACGPHGDETCCASPLVEGGEYDRLDPDDEMKRYHAIVSDFRLDRLEVTVGRFRRFVESYPANKPAKGAGAHPAIVGSGWDEAWPLPATREDLIADVKCNELYQTWTDKPAGDNENKPINCVSWFVAFAFCAWDEGRLPTEAEWNYAAARGSEGQMYPWGSDEPDETYAVYCLNYSAADQGCPSATLADIRRVGSKSTKGDGRWAQADLAGSLREWNLDWHALYPNLCDNCANLVEDILAREARGGDWNNNELDLRSFGRIGYDPSSRHAWVGLRCARRP